MNRALSGILFVLGLTVPAFSHALTVFCSNCATSIQAEGIIRGLTIGFDRTVRAIQGDAAAQIASTEAASRVVAEANAKVEQDMATSKALINYRPIDPCTATAMTNATTGGAGDSMRDRGAPVGRGGGGGGGGAGGAGAVPSTGLNDSMRRAIEISKGVTKAPSPEVQAALGASGACGTFVSGGARQRHCEGAGFSASPSNGHPNADVRAETLFDGPQKTDTIVRRLTYKGNSAEATAVEAFLRNLETPVDLRELTPAELKTDAGRNYMALRDAYEASLSLATKPARDQAMLLRANPNTKGIVEQLLQSDDGPFVRSYLARAYPNYASDGISIAELINLEAERRYKNPQWLVRMSQAPERALLQEQVQLQAVQLWMMAMLLERVQQLAVVQGNAAAGIIRTEKMPALVAAHRAAQR